MSAAEAARRVAVTGSSGKLGAVVARELRAAGYEPRHSWRDHV